MLSRLKMFLSKFTILKKVYHFLKKILGVHPPFNPIVEEVRAISPRVLYEFGSDIRLNILIPSISSQHIFGGIATALDFYFKLCTEMKAKSRIIVTDSVPVKEDYLKFKNYINISCSKNSIVDCQIVDFTERSHKTIPVAKNDIFMATAWWTAYNIYPVIKWQSEQYQCPENKLIYFIQDFEPGFYPWSTRYLLADSTYQRDIPTIAVFNSRQLKDYFHSNDYSFYREFFFEITLNHKLRNHLILKKELTRKKQILIYGRPSVSRNAFELIVDCLRKWAKIMPNAHEWTLLSVGEKHPDVRIASDLILKSLGKLTIDQYADVMFDSFLGISLMVSPHPSYPPLEMSTFGIKTITSAYGNKNLNGFNDNLVSLRNLSPDNIANTMVRLCGQFDPHNETTINEEYVYAENTFEHIINNIKIEYCLKKP